MSACKHIRRLRFREKYIIFANECLELFDAPQNPWDLRDATGHPDVPRGRRTTIPRRCGKSTAGDRKGGLLKRKVSQKFIELSVYSDRDRDVRSQCIERGKPTLN